MSKSALINVEVPMKSEAIKHEEVETDVETPFSSPERESVLSTSTTSTSMTTAAEAATTTTRTSVNTNAKSKHENSDSVVTRLLATAASSSSDDVKDDKDYENWPLKDIKDPHDNDVLYGRGGGTNHHPGNKRYRKLVEGRKVDYVNSKRLDKPLVALEIIKAWRSQQPPGRFLKLEEETGLWHDVGDKKAREKTSQALREKAPLLRKQQEEQRKEQANNNSINNTDPSKNTRFDLPQKNSKVSKNITRVMLERVHSLGRDYIPADEPVSVKGFSWTTPALDVPVEEAPTSTSWDSHQESDTYAYAVRGSGSSSVSRSSSQPSPSRCPPTLSSPNAPSTMNYSKEWASQLPHSPHTPQPNEALMNEWRSYSDGAAQQKSFATGDHDYRRVHSVDDAYQRTKQSYYNQGLPPPNGPAQGDDYERFATIVGSNNSNSYMQSWRQQNSDPMYDSSPYHSPDRMSSNESYRHGHNNWVSPHHTHPTQHHIQTSPQGSMDYYANNSYPSQENQRMIPDPSANAIVSPESFEGIPRPPTVKRDTSHKLETIDIEPTTKRMNRQSSIGHRTGSMSSVEEITDKDIRHLKNSLEQSSLATGNRNLKLSKPQSLTASSRLSTIDRLINDIEGTSSPLDGRSKNASPQISDGSLELSETIMRPSPLSDHNRFDSIGTVESDFISGLTNAAPV